MRRLLRVGLASQQLLQAVAHVFGKVGYFTDSANNLVEKDHVYRWQLCFMGKQLVADIHFQLIGFVF